MGFPVIFYMLFLGERRSGAIIDGTVPWRVYLMVSMCTFGALVAALNAGGSRLATERATGWARQLRITPMPAWSYVVTKVTASMLVVLPVLVLVELVGFTFGGVRLGVIEWFALTGLLWTTALPFAVLGVFVGFMVNAETAYPVVTALMFVLGYFGRLFNPVNQMPAALHLRPRRSRVSITPSSDSSSSRARPSGRSTGSCLLGTPACSAWRSCGSTGWRNHPASRDPS